MLGVPLPVEADPTGNRVAHRTPPAWNGSRGSPPIVLNR